jgi:hypothetical protein
MFLSWKRQGAITNGKAAAIRFIPSYLRERDGGEAGFAGKIPATRGSGLAPIELAMLQPRGERTLSRFSRVRILKGSGNGWFR